MTCASTAHNVDTYCAKTAKSSSLLYTIYDRLSDTEEYEPDLCQAVELSV